MYKVTTRQYIDCHMDNEFHYFEELKDACDYVRTEIRNNMKDTYELFDGGDKVTSFNFHFSEDAMHGCSSWTFGPVVTEVYYYIEKE